MKRMCSPLRAASSSSRTCTAPQCLDVHSIRVKNLASTLIVNYIALAGELVCAKTPVRFVKYDEGPRVITAFEFYWQIALCPGCRRAGSCRAIYNLKATD